MFKEGHGSDREVRKDVETGLEEYRADKDKLEQRKKIVQEITKSLKYSESNLAGGARYLDYEITDLGKEVREIAWTNEGSYFGQTDSGAHIEPYAIVHTLDFAKKFNVKIPEEIKKEMAKLWGNYGEVKYRDEHGDEYPHGYYIEKSGRGVPVFELGVVLLVNSDVSFDDENPTDWNQVDAAREEAYKEAEKRKKQLEGIGVECEIILGL